MGFGRVSVKYKDGTPAPNQKVVINFDWAGNPTGTFEDYTDNLGDAVFSGTPAFSAGRGKVIGSSGHFVEFTVGTNWLGDFDPIIVTTYWNPIQGGTDNVKSNLGALAKWLIDHAFVFAIIAIGAVVVYQLVKRTPVGMVATGLKHVVGSGRALVSRYVK